MHIFPPCPRDYHLRFGVWTLFTSFAYCKLTTASYFFDVHSLSSVWLFAIHGLQHTRIPCPSLSPQSLFKLMSFEWWCSLTVSSSAAPFSFRFLCFPASGSFPMSWLFASGGRRIGAFSFSISPSSDYSGLIPFRVEWLDWIDLAHGVIQQKVVGVSWSVAVACDPGSMWQHLLYLEVVVINILVVISILLFSFPAWNVIRFCS